MLNQKHELFVFILVYFELIILSILIIISPFLFKKKFLDQKNELWILKFNESPLDGQVICVPDRWSNHVG
jgi:hypothetical protein